ncbi:MULTISPECIES: bifunctional riboflavin kinase/FAD synthetase [Caloramator]|uniref:Riboflavin biosynthesis protein n=1 Tax=Caloramator proteoclasticus DSM 10124 TaxID=1121262 RepID=A0A1M4SNI2_9CLOT|nr:MULTISPECIES: bifunctional riboflavin kinase/FAD synthetase [Caloramator]SHE33507.1 riboflavin kinase / FMN adenylyltransferase [Caloramator proteoclasticus DSM 10124]
MKIINEDFRNILLDYNTTVALGMFDGVHIAHREIIKRAVLDAKINKTKSVVLTFEQDPDEFLYPDKKHKIITENKTKIKLIEELSPDYLILLKTNKELLNLNPEDFINFLINNIGIKKVVCGFDYKFGKKAKGNIDLLRMYANNYGYSLEVVDEIKINGFKVSSSAIREKLEKGLIIEANELLGYEFSIYGAVEKGNQIAREMGYPTANIYVDDRIALRNGVYATKTVINGKEYSSISNIGIKPTFNGKQKVLETHLFNTNINLYGKEIMVKFLKFIRDEQKFDSIINLKKRIQEDIIIARNI